MPQIPHPTAPRWHGGKRKGKALIKDFTPDRRRPLSEGRISKFPSLPHSHLKMGAICQAYTPQHLLLRLRYSQMFLIFIDDSVPRLRPCFSRLQLIFSFLRFIFSFPRFIFSFPRFIFSFPRFIFSFPRFIFSFLRFIFSFLRFIFSFPRFIFSFLRFIFSFPRL